MEVILGPLEDQSLPPMDLLLLADPNEKTVKDYLEKGRCFTATYQSEIVGVIVIVNTRPKTVEIMNVAVKEEYHNRGIGKKLVNYAVSQVDRSKINTIEIGTGNPGVIQMLIYQKCGFRIIGVDFDYFRRNCDEKIIENGVECRDMIRMRMEL